MVNVFFKPKLKKIKMFTLFLQQQKGVVSMSALTIRDLQQRIHTLEQENMEKDYRITKLTKKINEYQEDAKSHKILSKQLEDVKTFRVLSEQLAVEKQMRKAAEENYYELYMAYASMIKEQEKTSDKNTQNSVQLQQEVLRLRSEGKSYRKIGEELGISHTKAAQICKQNQLQQQVRQSSQGEGERQQMARLSQDKSIDEPEQNNKSAREQEK